MKRLIGLFGGSFNPVHTGHVALAKAILREAGLDEVWLMVSPLNPFKSAADDLLDDESRFLLVQKALQGETGLVASDYELHLPRPSYTWRTLQALRADYPSCEFILLVGADNWLAFDRWAHSTDILAHHRVVVYPREGYPIDAATLPTGVTLVDAPLCHVSSTDIRRRVRAGLPIHGLVPSSIETDVVRLYR